MNLIFTRSWSPLSAIIRLATWSTWSHVGVLLGDRVLDSTIRHGVAMRDMDSFMAGISAHRVVDVETENPLGVINALRSQIGKPYDLTGVLGMSLRRNWQEDDRWFCSELVAWAFKQSGQPLFRNESMYRITPQHLWMLPEMSNARS